MTPLRLTAPRAKTTRAANAALGGSGEAGGYQNFHHADFLPVVLRIVSVTQEATSSLWQVDTDRGTTEFVVDQEDHVRPLEDGRHLISDSHGMRYLVPVPSALDAPSRKILARFS